MRRNVITLFCLAIIIILKYFCFLSLRAASAHCEDASDVTSSIPTRSKLKALYTPGLFFVQLICINIFFLTVVFVMSTFTQNVITWRKSNIFFGRKLIHTANKEINQSRYNVTTMAGLFIVCVSHHPPVLSDKGASVPRRTSNCPQTSYNMSGTGRGRASAPVLLYIILLY